MLLSRFIAMANQKQIVCQVVAIVTHSFEFYIVPD